nr:hypothetical protein Iba_chr05cCG17960 [Ipomoea batatas]GMC98596.1 hypothetical protein Iba_chr05dCG18020 [Ipomoea batatas]GMD02330.1 hypothetical protein Iba_chr05fCG15600 [Ipomoea batatas]GMD30593.1 hypothetical protein Iba_chr09aCG8460 [Ipomoea batatas]
MAPCPLFIVPGAYEIRWNLLTRMLRMAAVQAPGGHFLLYQEKI